jgi:predicted nuclease of restriction endonuclease-like RecB superfamily
VKGIQKSEATKEKLRIKALNRKPSRTGAVLTTETKNKISNSLTKYFKENPEKIKRGRNCYLFGKSTPHGKHIKYRNIWLKSGWEEAFAKWCDKNNITWLYEPKTFDLGNTTYTPDFYLPETDEYVEVKGWWRDDAIEKFRLFKQNYRYIKLTLLERKELKLMKII